MGQSGTYECLSCGNQFGAQEGGGFFFDEYRCVDCDVIKVIRFRHHRSKIIKMKPSNSMLGVCQLCGVGSMAFEIPCKCKDTYRLINDVDFFEDYPKKYLEDPIGDCKECGGELRNDLKPMCPACKSRDVKIIYTGTYYD
jgi:hypothetical protein